MYSGNVWYLFIHKGCQENSTHGKNGKELMQRLDEAQRCVKGDKRKLCNILASHIVSKMSTSKSSKSPFRFVLLLGADACVASIKRKQTPKELSWHGIIIEQMYTKWIVYTVHRTTPCRRNSHANCIYIYIFCSVA